MGTREATRRRLQSTGCGAQGADELVFFSCADGGEG